MMISRFAIALRFSLKMKNWFAEVITKEQDIRNGIFVKKPFQMKIISSLHEITFLISYYDFIKKKTHLS